MPIYPVGLFNGPVAAGGGGVTVSRSNSASISGSNTSLSIGWVSGGAAASGKWLVAVCRNNTGNSYNITGGSAWTEIGTSNIFYKQCGASEPTTYSCSYFGSKKDEAQSITIIELSGVTSFDEAVAAATTNTLPTTATSSNSNGLVVIAGGLAGFILDATITPPAGYTTQSKHDKSNDAGLYTPNAVTIIATKSPVGATGDNSPGSFSVTNSNTLNQVAVLIFQ